MFELFALDDAAWSTISIIVVWVIAFPALVTGLIVFAAAQAAGERQENQARRAKRES